MSESKRKLIQDLEYKFYKGLWEYSDGEKYGSLITGSSIWLTPESYLSY